MFFDCTADLVGQLNGNSQKGMLQIDAPLSKIISGYTPPVSKRQTAGWLVKVEGQEVSGHSVRYSLRRVAIWRSSAVLQRQVPRGPDVLLVT